MESKQFTDGYSAGYHVAMRKTMQQEDLAYVSGLDAGTIALRVKAEKFGAFAGNVLGVRDSHMHGFLVGLMRPLGLYRAKHRQDWDSLVNATVTPQMMNIVSPAQLPSRLAIIPPQKEGVNYDVVTPPLIQENWEEQLGSNAVMPYLIFFLSFSADGRSLFLGFLSQLLQVLRFM